MSGFQYFLKGFSLATLPGIRRFVILPLVVNLFLFGVAFYFLFSTLSEKLNSLILSWLPEMLHFLSFIIEPLAFIAILVVFAYFFSTIANLIAAPFNGLLAEQLEAKLTGKPLPNESLKDLLKDLPRIIKREWQKLAYYIPKAIGLLLLLLIPAIGQTAGPVLWFLFSGWMMAIQYLDYPFDNHKVPFREMRDQLASPYSTSISFGTCVLLCTMIPVLNLVVMPVAVCGATALWVDKYKAESV
uniref:sulfate transporter CysZ n=1 Tax=Thaumasiovibrio subtropicus TaxID=1891207 RepID=UPI000B35B514|nr:sulfate transporter CysZ [Thaumasiovibrio subtropicus]